MRGVPILTQPHAEWRARDKRIALDHAIIVAILNVTPDSFSDGGRLLSVHEAVARATEMLDEGADVIDVGGESTRPNATPVLADDEIRRVRPVIEGIRRAHPAVPISVDTTKGSVGAAALDAGADIINDVSAFRLDSALCEITSRYEAGAILMHSRGAAGELASYDHASYGADSVAEIAGELLHSARAAEERGIARQAIVLDPGLGFSKRTEQSVAVLAELDRFVLAGYPVLVGASRKRFIGELSNVQRAQDRLEGTLAAHVAALMKGASLFRVHDVRAHRRALDVAWAIRYPSRTAGA